MCEREADRDKEQEKDKGVRNWLSAFSIRQKERQTLLMFDEPLMTVCVAVQRFFVF